ncbi:hypothetical protein [Luteimicrobium sp. DT211]|uniref:hypothetical protein n=1 Tax=Luteimicrobium sp. DT211 TaxID=3393412 RepID=UPI003CF3CB18
MRSIIRAAVAAAASLCAAIALIAATSSTASAEPSLATCVGTASVDYGPGVRLTPQLVTVTALQNYPTCVTGEDGVTAATASSSFVDTVGCDTLLGSSTGVRTYHWNDGTTSRFEYTRSATRVLSQTVATFTGTITAGRFAGSSVIETNIGPTLGVLDCLSAVGVTHIDFVAALQIL